MAAVMVYLSIETTRSKYYLPLHQMGLMLEIEQSLPAGQVPVAAYVGSSMLKDLKGAVPSHEEKHRKTPDQHRTEHPDGAHCCCGSLREKGGVEIRRGTVLEGFVSQP